MGEGDVLVKGGGTVVNKEPQTAKTLRVASGSIVAFESIIEYVAMMHQNAMPVRRTLLLKALKVWLRHAGGSQGIVEIARDG
jgi:hypothetical protein